MAPFLNVHNWMREIIQDCGKAALLQALAVGGKTPQAVKKGDASNCTLPFRCVLCKPRYSEAFSLYQWGASKKLPGTRKR